MKLIKTLTEADFGFDNPIPEKYAERRATRAIIFDDDNNIALVHVTKKNYHLLPGGGIEEGESIIDGFKRELLEEVGCSPKNIRELGIIDEYRNEGAGHQISYCFVADLDGEKGIPMLEEDERDAGCEPVWMSLDKAIETLENEIHAHGSYKGKFTNARNILFLKEAKK